MDRLLEIGRSLADTETTAYLLQQDFVLLGLAAIALLGLLPRGWRRTVVIHGRRYWQPG
mgnify:CR=1 FL=1